MLARYPSAPFLFHSIIVTTNICSIDNIFMTDLLDYYYVKGISMVLFYFFEMVWYYFIFSIFLTHELKKNNKFTVVNTNTAFNAH